MRIGVLNNLQSTRNAGRMDHVLEVLRGHPDVVHIETEMGAMVPEALAGLEAKGVELLVVNGGDGTVHHVLTELLAPEVRGWLPLIAPLRGGRTNMTAMDFGAHRNPLKGLAQMIADVKAGRLEERVVERPVIRLDLGDGTPPQYGFFFGVGMLYRAVQLPPNYPGPIQNLIGIFMLLGSLVARAAVGRSSGILTPDKMQIVLNEAPIRPDEFKLVMATTLERLFFGINPFWGTEDAPLKVTSLAAGAPMLKNSAGILRGKPPAAATPEAGFHSHNVEAAAFRLDCGVMLDGEVFPPEPDRLVKLRADDRLRFVRA